MTGPRILLSLALLLAAPAALADPPPKSGYAEGPRYTLRDAPMGAPAERRLGPGPSVVLSADASVMLFFGGRQTAVLAGGKRRTLAGPRSYRGACSPDGTLVATSTEEGVVTVFASATGARKATWTLPHALGAAEIAFSDGKTLYFHSGCRLLRLAPSGGPPVAVGPALCEEARQRTAGPTATLDRGARFARVGLVDPTRRLGYGYVYSQVRLIDVASGAAVITVDGTEARPIQDPNSSPTGDRLCFRSTGDALWCATAGRPPERIVETMARRYVTFNPQGTVLAFNAPGPDGLTNLSLVSFADRTVRVVAATDRASYEFLSDGATLLASGGPNPKGLDLFQLAAGTARRCSPATRSISCRRSRASRGASFSRGRTPRATSSRWSISRSRRDAPE